MTRRASAEDARLERIARDLGDAGFAIEPGFLPRGECARLARRGRALWRRGALREAAIGRGAARERRPEIRGDFVRWIDPAAATRGEAALLARVERLRVALNRSLQLGAFDLELHWALYPPGAHYARHLDRFRGDARARGVAGALPERKLAAAATAARCACISTRTHGATSRRSPARSSRSSRIASSTKCCPRAASG